MGLKGKRGLAVLVALVVIFGAIFGTALAFYSEGYLSGVVDDSKTPDKTQAGEVLGEWEEYYGGELNTLLAQRFLGIESSYFRGLKENKVAYLTFDDGPSSNTPEILEVLERYGVKATFFVNGWNKKNYKEMYRMIYEKGHALGNHTYSHRYDLIYSSVENFMADLKKQEEMIYEATGIRPRIIRFPGGSDNLVSIRYGGADIMKKIAERLKKEGYIYVDWNASAGDALKPPPSREQMMDYVRLTTKGKNPVVLLMHDMNSKRETLEILPWIIEYLRNEGYEFRVIHEGISDLDLRKKL